MRSAVIRLNNNFKFAFYFCEFFFQSGRLWRPVAAFLLRAFRVLRVKLLLRGFAPLREIRAILALEEEGKTDRSPESLA